MRAWFLILTMFLSALPAYARYSGGSGTADDPYQIATADDLISLGASQGDYAAHFVLVEDIALDPHFTRSKAFGRAVIAPSTTAFAGVFDGGGHTISRLTIRGGDYLGLFGRVAESGEVRNLALVDVNVIGSGCYVGGLVGLNEGRIRACYVKGEVRGDFRVGGFAGGNFGVITASYAQARMSGTRVVGGFVGSDRGTIVRCYATGQVAHAEGGDFLGGFAGERGGGGAIEGCLWDTQASGIGISACGIGFDTAKLMESDAYALNGWAGDPNWVIDAGRDYARLAWEGSPGQAIGEPGINNRLTGSGTPEDPYQIATADQLALVGAAGILWDKALVLVADLDVNGIEVRRIGICSGSEFRGSFDGRGHTIRNLTMDTGALSAWWTALFGWIHADGRIVNLNLEHAVIKVGGQRPGYLGALAGLNRGSISNCTATSVLVDGRSSPGGNSTYLGGLVGYNNGSIDQCRASGDVRGDWEVGGLVGLNHGSVLHCRADAAVSGEKNLTGGLVGINMGVFEEVPGAFPRQSVLHKAVIKNCCATGQVTGKEDSYETGGLAGRNQDGDITGCYATGAVSGGFTAGGLVGGNASGGAITNSYATGDVIGHTVVGGFVALNAGTVTTCYATGKAGGGGTVGGLAGWDWDGTVAKSFWDIQTSGLSESAGGTGKTTAEMQKAQTFLAAEWDFVGETANGSEDIWWIDEGKDYPRLAWEAASE